MAADRLNFHAIIGPNGMCMCGVEADGTVVTCGALLDAYVAEQAKLAASPPAQEQEPKLKTLELEVDFGDGPITIHHYESNDVDRLVAYFRSKLAALVPTEPPP